MTTEQLMQPRYKVIADYPGSEFAVGDIIIYQDESEEKFFIGVTNQYPHLFKKLEWGKERKNDELPKYVSDRYVPKSSEWHKVYIVNLYDMVENTIMLDNCVSSGKKPKSVPDYGFVF